MSIELPKVEFDLSGIMGWIDTPTAVTRARYRDQAESGVSALDFTSLELIGRRELLAAPWPTSAQERPAGASFCVTIDEEYRSSSFEQHFRKLLSFLKAGAWQVVDGILSDAARTPWWDAARGLGSLIVIDGQHRQSSVQIEEWTYAQTLVARQVDSALGLIRTLGGLRPGRPVRVVPLPSPQWETEPLAIACGLTRLTTPIVPRPPSAESARLSGQRQALAA